MLLRISKGSSRVRSYSHSLQSIDDWHWFLIAVFPNKYLMAVLDSAASDFVKPSAGVVMKNVLSIEDD